MPKATKEEIDEIEDEDEYYFELTLSEFREILDSVESHIEPRFELLKAEIEQLRKEVQYTTKRIDERPISDKPDLSFSNHFFAAISFFLITGAIVSIILSVAILSKLP